MQYMPGNAKVSARQH